MTDTTPKAVPASEVEPDDLMSMIEYDLMGLMSMVEYLKIEVPHYLEESLMEVKAIKRFDFTEVLGPSAGATVYQVQLESGEKVYAVNGGFFGGKFHNVYAEKFPTAEIAAKAHVYISALLIERGNSVAKALGFSEQIASQLSLPQRIQRVFTGQVIPHPIGVNLRLLL